MRFYVKYNFLFANLKLTKIKRSFGGYSNPEMSYVWFTNKWKKRFSCYFRRVNENNFTVKNPQWQPVFFWRNLKACKDFFAKVQAAASLFHRKYIRKGMYVFWNTSVFRFNWHSFCILIKIVHSSLNNHYNWFISTAMPQLIRLTSNFKNK